MSRELTIKQERFCTEYHKSGNGRQSYLVAYPKSKTWSIDSVDRMAHELLKNIKVISRLNELSKLQQERSLITVDRTLKELACIAFSDHQQYFTIDDDGTIRMRKLDQLPEGASRAIASIKQTVHRSRSNEDEESEVINTEFKLWDKNKAIEMIGRTLGMFIDVQKLQVLLPDIVSKMSTEDLEKNVGND